MRIYFLRYFKVKDFYSNRPPEMRTKKSHPKYKLNLKIDWFHFLIFFSSGPWDAPPIIYHSLSLSRLVYRSRLL